MSSYSSEEVAAALKRAMEVRKLLDQYPELVSRERLKRVAGMLTFVNFTYFAIMSSVAFAWLAPIVTADDRPAWSLWLIFGPLAGLMFGGVGGLIVWNLYAAWLGSFLFRRQRDPASAELWEAFISDKWDRRRSLD